MYAARWWTRASRTALCGAMALGFAPALSSAQTASGDPLARAEEAFARVDFPSARASAQASLESGGHTPVEVARIWYLLGMSGAAMHDDAAARDAFERLLALSPAEPVEQNLAPPLRGPLTAARAYWTARTERFGAVVDRGANGMEVRVTDPLHMARAVAVRLRPGAQGTFVPARVPAAPVVEIPFPAGAAEGRIDYAVRVVDEWGNRLVELGTEAAPRTAPPAPHAVAVVVPPGTARSEPSPWRWAGVAGVGIGAAALVGGVAAAVLRESHAASWNSADCLRNGQTRAGNCGAERDAANQAQGWSIAGFAVGGALAISGAVVWLWSGRATSTRALASRTALRCEPGPGTAGVACTIGF